MGENFFKPLNPQIRSRIGIRFFKNWPRTTYILSIYSLDLNLFKLEL